MLLNFEWFFGENRVILGFTKLRMYAEFKKVNLSYRQNGTKKGKIWKPKKRQKICCPIIFLVFQKHFTTKASSNFRISLKFFIFTSTQPTIFKKIIFIQKPLLAKKPPKTTNIEFSETFLDNFSPLKNTLQYVSRFKTDAYHLASTRRQIQ